MCRDHEHLTQTWQPRSSIEVLGLKFVEAFNDRDLETGLSLAHPEVVARPSRLSSVAVADGYRGHDGIREWWEVASRRVATQVLVHGMEVIDTEPLTEAAVTLTRLAVFGDVYVGDEIVAPWITLLVFHDELIIEQQSYLSTRQLITELGMFDRQAPRAR